MNTTQIITPLYATHPGEILLDELNAINISQIDFAKQIGLKRSQLNEIIKGKRNINADLALLLEKALGIDADYWLEAQKNFDLDSARIVNKNQIRLEAIEQWNLIKEHLAWRFFKKESVLVGDPVEDIPMVKKIYDVQNFEQLVNLNAQPTYARFRKSTKLINDPVNIIGWTKLIQYKAKTIRIGHFDNDKKVQLMERLRTLLAENRNTLERVRQLLSEFGIKLVYQQKGEKTPVDGISFWSDRNPAIGMSLRHNRLDNYAFTLFHELGHIFEHLVNNNNAEFVDLINSREEETYKDSIEEKEANEFAHNFLMDKTAWNNFFEGNRSFSDPLIISFAEEIGVHPCIVRGRICFTIDYYAAKTNIDYSIG
jgi:HTH-type transcriptional regulator/antitoxin HigA